MKKTVIFTVLMSMMLSMFSIAASAEEEEFKRTDFYYDFNNYTATMGSGIGPDEHWDYAYYPNKDKTEWTKSDKRKWFGGAVDSETGSGVMHVQGRNGGPGEPVLVFGELLNKGSFHISFDVKFNTTTDKLFLGLYDGHNGTGDAKIMNEQNYPVTLAFYDSGDVRYITKTAGVGDSTDGNDLRWSTFWGPVADSGLKYRANTWHHVDLYFGDCGKVDTATARYYFDGERVNPYDLYYKGCNGFMGLFFRTEGSSADVYIDNVYFSNFKGEETLHGFLDSKFLNESTHLIKLKLSEPANKEITANDIKITYANTGEAVTDFTVESQSNLYADIRINGEVPRGRYDVELKSSVKGSYYENPMEESVSFLTPSVYEDGVACPNIEDIVYKNYKGETQNKKAGISTATTSIEVDFTSEIADGTNITDNIKLLNGGEAVQYKYELSADSKRVTIMPQEAFDAETDYSLFVGSNIASSSSANAKMGVDYTDNFTTLNDPRFAIEANDIKKDGDDSYFNVKIIKTNENEGHSYTYAQAAYKEHKVKDAKGVEKTYLEMTSVNRFPVIISGDRKGITSLGDDQPLNISGADKVNGFLWEFPNNLPTVVK